jgi:hypothetical protein
MVQNRAKPSYNKTFKKKPPQVIESPPRTTDGNTRAFDGRPKPSDPFREVFHSPRRLAPDLEVQENQTPDE